MLHFRSFIIPALMAGAALFLPNQTFAEKHEPGEQIKSPVAEVQSTLKKADQAVTKVNVPSKPQQAAPVVGKKAAVPATASKGQVQLVQHVPKQAVSKKQATRPKALPAQANGNDYVHSAIKKPAVKTSIKEEPNSSVTDNPIKQADQAVVKRITTSNGPVPVEIKAKKIEQMEPVAPLPVKEKAPAGKEELPTADQSVNPAQRSNNTGGGQSNDRISQGLHSISFLEKWFEWNKHYEIKHVQPFLSRYDLKHHQWVNAPPSPPPQTAPLFNTVTRS